MREECRALEGLNDRGRRRRGQGSGKTTERTEMWRYSKEKGQYIYIF